MLLVPHSVRLSGKMDQSLLMPISHNNNIPDDIICPVCMEIYSIDASKNPVMLLGCGHTICRGCLTSIYEAAQNRYDCPICRAPYTGPHPSTLPANYLVLSLIQPYLDHNKSDDYKAVPSFVSPADALPMVSAAVARAVVSSADTRPVVYLDLQVVIKSLGDLQVGIKSLGRIRIRLTCGPRRQKQMMLLCGKQGSSYNQFSRRQEGPTFKGSGFQLARLIGRPGESVWCRNYINQSGEISSDPLVNALEGDVCKFNNEGSVTGVLDGAGFSICTRTDPSSTLRAPRLGQVVSGIQLLREALAQYNASQIIIAGVGAEIGIKENIVHSLVCTQIPKALSKR
ncbi:unnamed protein product [Meganyctiphanes norvegica]|uniref:RING-type domain-containing protein n=1 Tax=Meganyctiphanes norvegica TaxID=48144 RepID=A0AAV2PFZ4_MEGNR